MFKEYLKKDLKAIFETKSVDFANAVSNFGSELGCLFVVIDQEQRNFQFLVIPERGILDERHYGDQSHRHQKHNCKPASVADEQQYFFSDGGKQSKHQSRSCLPVNFKNSSSRFLHWYC